jgi:hypothetical protein
MKEKIRKKNAPTDQSNNRAQEQDGANQIALNAKHFISFAWLSGTIYQ